MAHFPLLLIIPETGLVELASPANQQSWPEALHHWIDPMMEPHRTHDECPPYQTECDCIEIQRSALDERISAEADQKFGAFEVIAASFEQGRGPLPMFPGLAAEDQLVEKSWTSYRNWLMQWTAALNPRQFWIQSKTMEGGQVIAAKSDCEFCHGLGTMESTWKSGDWDGYTIGGRYDKQWQELNSFLGMNAFVWPSGLHFSDLNKTDLFHNISPGKALHYALRHDPKLLGTDVLLKDGRWLSQAPGAWGVARLSPDLKGLHFYAEDEFWPQKLYDSLQPNLADGDLGVMVDCHT